MKHKACQCMQRCPGMDHHTNLMKRCLTHAHTLYEVILDQTGRVLQIEPCGSEIYITDNLEMDQSIDKALVTVSIHKYSENLLI